jgi:hypothetical protein
MWSPHQHSGVPTAFERYVNIFETATRYSADLTWKLEDFAWEEFGQNLLTEDRF